ncbi:MAG: hypothetical protein D6795_16525, partial [Deltaproteobacteria bacterium]
TGTGTKWVNPSTLSISDGDWVVSGNNMYSGVSGNVGIGTSSPGQKLDVNGSIVARNNLMVGQTSTTGYQSIPANGNDLIVNGQFAAGGTGGSAIYKLGVGYAPPAGGEGSLNVAGDVGIGTTSPSAKLHVVGSFKASSIDSGERSILMEAPSSVHRSGQAARGLVFRVATNPGSGDPIFQVRSSGQAIRFFVEHDGWTGAIDNSAYFAGTAKPNYFATSVGIGTASPSQALHVAGNIRVTGAYYDSSNSAGTNGYLLQSTGTGTKWVNPSTLSISDGDWVVAGSNMYAGVSGNVGVGTTSPAYKLDVVGDVRASGAIMGGNHITHTQWYGATNNYRGYIKLITPIIHNESNMFSIHIMGYGYNYGSDAIDIRCGGYAYSASTLISTDCHTEGTDLPVEIGTETRSGRKVVVIRIGTPTTSWYYPHFSAEYVGWIKKNPSDFVWTVGETSPAQT